MTETSSYLLVECNNAKRMLNELKSLNILEKQPTLANIVLLTENLASEICKSVIDCSSNISIPIMLKKLIYFLKIESNKNKQHNEFLSFTMDKISKRL